MCLNEVLITSKHCLFSVAPAPGPHKFKASGGVAFPQSLVYPLNTIKDLRISLIALFFLSPPSPPPSLSRHPGSWPDEAFSAIVWFTGEKKKRFSTRPGGICHLQIPKSLYPRLAVSLLVLLPPAIVWLRLAISGRSAKCQCKARVLSKNRVHMRLNKRQSIVLINKPSDGKHGNLLVFFCCTNSKEVFRFAAANKCFLKTW